MELVEVEIIAQVITSRYGTLSTGDILKTDQAFADHLVNDCKGAKWPDQKVVAAPPADEAQADEAPAAPAEPDEKPPAAVEALAPATAKTKATSKK